MSENAKGEVVKVVAEQFNEAEERISYVTAEWYGMANAQANALSMGLAGAVVTVANEGAKAKEALGKMPGLGDKPKGNPTR